MKAKITMIVETNKQTEDFELESHIKDALVAYTGNEIEFFDCEIKSISCGIENFVPELRELACIESFEASHTNLIDGETIKSTKHFQEGIKYTSDTWRPEGMRIDGFFVFNANASKFARIP